MPSEKKVVVIFQASILYKSTAGRYRPVSYPDGLSIDLCRMLTGLCAAAATLDTVVMTLRLCVVLQ